MVWPYNTPKVIPFEGALQITSPTSIQLPMVILTSNTINLFDTQHHVIISTHTRSEESLTKYGNNVYFKMNYQQDIIGVSTDQGYLLIYSIAHQDEELLSVYSKSSEMLQNGLVLNKQLSFFEKLHIENPIASYQLRFKVFLKIHNDLKDFVLMNHFEMVLLTSKNVQVLDLHNSNDDIAKFEGNPISRLIHSKPINDSDLSLFFVIDNQDKGRVYVKKGKVFSLLNDFVVDDVVEASINLKLGLILLLHSDRKQVSFYNYKSKLVTKSISYQDTIKSIRWTLNNTAYSLLFDNKTWSTNSVFGSSFFKSSEDNDTSIAWLNKVSYFDILLDQSYIILSDSTNLYVVALLTNINIGNPINYNLKRPILVSNGEVHIYSTYENKTNNWNIIRVPFEEYHQLIQITHASLSNDYKYLALSNNKNVLIHSLTANDWSFYINDYNHEMDVQHLTWFSKLNLLIVTNRTNYQDELIIFDFKNFNNEVNFDSTLVVFKYDFNSKIVAFNVLGNDILIVTENLKSYNFKIEILRNRGIKIDLARIISFENIFKDLSSLQNVFKIDSNSEDLLLHQNNQIIYLKHQDNTFEKFFLFENVEYLSRIDQDNYYLFNGESLIIIKDLSTLLQSVSAQAKSNSILEISTSHQNYPILLNLNNGLFVTLENEIISKKSMQLNTITTGNSIFLHDLIKFEMNNKDNDVEYIFNKYSKFKNFQYSLELLLYKSIEEEEDDEGTESPDNLTALIKHNPIYELNIVSKCLRKIEIENWNKLLNKLSLTSDELIDKSIKLKQFHTLSILIIIFLNYNDQNKLIVVETSPSVSPPPASSSNSNNKSKKKKKGKNGKGNGSKSTKKAQSAVINEEYDQDKLLEILKLIYTNAKDEELWDACFELLRFFKILDKSGELLKKGIETLESV